MKYLVLIDGMPDNGKTTAANKLGESGFGNISLDTAYVAFIEQRYKQLYFADLDKFIAPHFNEIVTPGYQRLGLYPDILTDWTQWVVDKIMKAGTDNVVCEGYLLRPRDETLSLSSPLRSRFSSSAIVRLVTAKKTVQGYKLYESGNEVSLDDLTPPPASGSPRKPSGCEVF